MKEGVIEVQEWCFVRALYLPSVPMRVQTPAEESKYCTYRFSLLNSAVLITSRSSAVAAFGANERAPDWLRAFTRIMGKIPRGLRLSACAPTANHTSSALSEISNSHPPPSLKTVLKPA